VVKRTGARCTSAALLACGVLLVISVSASAQPRAPAQQPASDLSSLLDPDTLCRLKESLRRSPEGRLTLDVQFPVATFRTTVEQRVYLPDFTEQLHNEFALTVLLRQSQDWSARCCGVGLDALVEILLKKLQARAARKIREEVARELAQVEAATRKPPEAGVPPPARKSPRLPEP